MLNVLSGIANRFRVRLGESLKTVRQHDAPLAEATTPSLEALKAYTAGGRVILSSGGAVAVPFFKRAIEIDPEFAMAYSLLGRAYGDIGESELLPRKARPGPTNCAIGPATRRSIGSPLPMTSR